MFKKITAILLLFFCVFGFANDLATIQRTKKVRIGVRLSQPPFSVLNSNNEFEGFEAELAKKLGEKLVGENGYIELVGVSANDRIPFLDSNKVDLLVANYTQNDERAKKVSFSMPYLSNNLAVISHKSKNIKTVKDLYNVKLLVIKGTTSIEWLEEKGISNFDLVYCSNSKDCFEKLTNGEGDAYLHTNILVAYIPLLDPDFEMSIKIVGNIDFIAAAAKKDNKDLIKFVNKSILELSKEGFFKQAYESTLLPFYKGTLDKKFLLLDDIYNAFI